MLFVCTRVSGIERQSNLSRHFPLCSSIFQVRRRPLPLSRSIRFLAFRATRCKSVCALYSRESRSTERRTLGAQLTLVCAHRALCRRHIGVFQKNAPLVKFSRKMHARAHVFCALVIHGGTNRLY